MDVITEDLEHVLERSRDDLDLLRGQRMLITGGTGFVGTWLTRLLCEANQQLELQLSLTILSRDPAVFAQREPRIAAWADCIQGDVNTFTLPGTFDLAVHAATPASAALIDTDPMQMREIIVDGTKRVLAALEPSGDIPLLLTSSGAVYGAQARDTKLVSEEHALSAAVTNPYALGKREAEALCHASTLGGGPSLRLARLFTFVGPLLPLDGHFAIGNFIRDAIAGGPIHVMGTGDAIRSYMYAGDMTEALLAILLRGTPNRPYNVGSETEISIASLADVVRGAIAPDAEVAIAGLAEGELPTGSGSRYVPSMARLRDELHVSARTSLPESIRRTADWASG